MSINYRPDIDGLRAIAVLLVIFNHVGWSFFSGGYIGVDIFFVISGYLITTILLKDMQQQRFSVAQFYKKRVIRLAPAYFTVLLTVSAVGYWLLLPQELVQYSKSLIYSTFLMANIYMRKEVGDYFSNSVDETPLLHLWSLGVEEQFYIFWPLILLFLLRKVPLKWLGVIIAGLILCSLLNAELAIAENAAKAYYTMPVRAFELLLGALISFLPRWPLKRFWSWLGITLSLVILAFCALYFNENTHFPGRTALLPCLATALIIYLGQLDHKTNLLLNNPLSRYLGKLSYPMYLWHWPLIVLFQLHLWPLTLFNQFLIIGVTLILAYITYRWVEMPCKTFIRVSTPKVILWGFVIPAVIVTTAAASVIQHKGFPQRFSPEVNQQIAALQSFAHRIRINCHGYPNAEELPSIKRCILGEHKAEIDFLLIGDSHANHFTGMLDVWAKDAHLRGYDVTQDTTVYLPGVEMLEESSVSADTVDQTFKARNEAITAHLKEHRYKFVVLSGYFNHYFDEKLRTATAQHTEQAYMQGLRNAIQQIKASGAQPVILMDTPDLQELRASCPVRATALHLKNVCQGSYLQFQQESAKFLQMVQQLSQSYPDLVVIDPALAMCDQQVCQLSLNGVPLYRDQDDDHLNYQGSTELGREYLKRFGNPLRF